MTERIYEKDSYCREFKAKVVSCESKDGGYGVVLDRTAFFAEGGGQAADEGEINGVRVLDVQIEGEEIVHKTESALEVGSEVTGRLDWELRFSRMQSHSGEHIVSGVVHSLFGYDNVGFHMSETVMTVDFSGVLSGEDIERVEEYSNRAIYANEVITASYPSKEEASALEYRSKKEITEGLRLITIENVDCCACCAPHPARTGEIGLIKIIDAYPYKQGTRIEMLAGINALKDYVGLNKSNKYLMGVLSAPREKVKEAVDRQLEAAGELRSENQRISKELALCKVVPVAVGDGIYAVSEGVLQEDLRYCSNTFLEKGINTCVLLSKIEGENYIYVVSSKTRDTREIVAVLNKSFNGKGGGKPDYAQGKLTAASEEYLIKTVEEILK